MEYEVYKRTSRGTLLTGIKQISPAYVAKIKGSTSIIGEFETEREAIDACGRWAAQEVMHQLEKDLGYWPD